MTDPAAVARYRDEQTRLYGAPLGTVVAELTEVYAVSRGRLAGLLGLSAPMLSQLAGGHRLKIGNPAAVQRLQRLMELVPDVRSGRLSAEVAMTTVAGEREGGVLTRSTLTHHRQGAADVALVLRWAASASELEAAASLLEPAHPALAEVLRVYGTGRADDAAAHFERLRSG